MQNVKAAVSQIDRLLATFPAPSNVDPRVRFGSYLTAVEDYDADSIVKPAVTAFLKGQVLDHNAAFAPSPAQLAGECRRILNQRITENQRRQAAILQIEQREEIFHAQPPELRRMAVAEGLARLTSLNPPPDAPEQQEERKAAVAARLAAHDARFVDNSPEAIKARLLKPRV